MPDGQCSTPQIAISAFSKGAPRRTPPAHADHAHTVCRACIRSASRRVRAPSDRLAIRAYLVPGCPGICCLCGERGSHPITSIGTIDSAGKPLDAAAKEHLAMTDKSRPDAPASHKSSSCTVGPTSSGIPRPVAFCRTRYSSCTVPVRY